MMADREAAAVGLGVAPPPPPLATPPPAARIEDGGLGSQNTDSLSPPLLQASPSVVGGDEGEGSEHASQALTPLDPLYEVPPPGFESRQNLVGLESGPGVVHRARKRSDPSDDGRNKARELARGLTVEPHSHILHCCW